MSRYEAANGTRGGAAELSENLYGAVHCKTISARSEWTQLVQAESRFDEALELHQNQYRVVRVGQVATNPFTIVW